MFDLTYWAGWLVSAVRESERPEVHVGYSLTWARGCNSGISVLVTWAGVQAVWGSTKAARLVVGNERELRGKRE